MLAVRVRAEGRLDILHHMTARIRITCARLRSAVRTFQVCVQDQSGAVVGISLQIVGDEASKSLTKVLISRVDVHHTSTLLGVRGAGGVQSQVLNHEADGDVQN